MMSKTIIYVLAFAILATGCRIFSSATKDERRIMPAKPVIYLYPETSQKVTVKISLDGKITTSYPKYPTEGWSVLAKPDGTLINLKDSSKHYYLFWEGELDHQLVLDQQALTGFVVRGSESLSFLKETLPKTGLTPKEYNDMIVYWLPLLEKNKYNFIHFLINDDYDQISTMNITPSPSSVLRVFMAYQKLDEYQQVTPQVISPTTRVGFTVVEWGGDQIDNMIQVKPKS